MNKSKKITPKNTTKANCGAGCRCVACSWVAVRIADHAVHGINQDPYLYPSCACRKSKCKCGCTNKI